jgi:phosphatidate cytidylyltransferase
MLKARVITALILAPTALVILFALPATGFAITIGGIVLVAAWEWIRLCGGFQPVTRMLLLAGFAAFLGAAYSLPALLIPNVLLLGLLFWLVAFFFVARYPISRSRLGREKTKLLFGLLVLVPAYVALLYLRRHPLGDVLIALLIGVIWSADVGAFFVGQRFGRSKLKPAVSPGKSWAGVVGGIGFALAIAVVAGFWEESRLMMTPRAWLVLLAISALTVVFSVLGDLFESLMKRERGVKDSSSLLPGHGGVLDRIDSLTAAAPVFALLIHLTAWPIV